MHRELIRRPRPDGRDEQGAVAILFALTIALIVVCAGYALDFGLLRVDRQVDESVADDAVLAGLHGLNANDGSPHPYMGVCTAIHFLQANNDNFSGVDAATGWTNGLGVPTASGCTSTTLRNRTCSATDRATWAVWQWTGTTGGVTYSVSIQSAYQLGTLSTSSWPEDQLPASSSDTSSFNGCDQLGVTINQSRQPTFGRLATSGDLSTRIRSVGRVRLQPGRAAPALLLLKRTGCPVLSAGNSGGGSGTYIHVLGAYSTSSGITQPGTIHADTDGTACTGGSNQNIFLGLQNDGIVAYAAPLLGNPSSPDPTKPGMITSVAAANGVATGIIRDGLAYVHGSSTLNSAATGGTQYDVAGRQLVTRSLIDQRYGVGSATPTGVPLAVSQANAVFTAGASGAPAGWTKFPASVNACKPTQAQINALTLTASSKLYVDCTTNSGFQGDGSNALTLNAGTIYFNGVVSPSGSLSLANATKVYIADQASRSDAVTLSTGATFGVNNATSNLNSGLCSSGQKSSKATLFIRTGDFKETGGTLQLCRTTVFMMGGSSTGCLPTTAGTAPTSSPCPGINSGLGTGQFTQTGGNIDWTAPDTLDQTLDSKGNPLAAGTAAWTDPSGPEDLALWSESATNSSSTYNMNGGGAFHVRGVFMVPNAGPFQISGGANMNLTNAQYIVTSIQLSGGTQITMSVDPNSAVTVPDIGLVGLVR
jgi:hypothetical protein